MLIALLLIIWNKLDLTDYPAQILLGDPDLPAARLEPVEWIGDLPFVFIDHFTGALHLFLDFDFNQLND